MNGLGQKMRSMGKLLMAAMILLVSRCSYCSDEILYWMVDDTSVVHYSDGTTVAMPYMVPDAVDTTLAARVRVVGGGLTEDVFLNMYIGDGEYWTTEWGIDFEDPGSGYWGVGNPTGIQSPLTGGGAPDYPYVVPVEGTPEYSFIIEIGNYDWNEDTWTTVAQSIAYTHSEIMSYVHYSFDISPPTSGIWNPHDYYAVPEPNSLLLIMLGVCMVGLKRKLA